MMLMFGRGERRVGGWALGVFRRSGKNDDGKCAQVLSQGGATRRERPSQRDARHNAVEQCNQLRRACRARVGRAVKLRVLLVEAARAMGACCGRQPWRRAEGSLR